jgi:hypothetical protein
VREADRHPLVVGQCTACGLTQLIDPMRPAMAKSRFDWLTYNEPEGHLDDLVTRLCRLPGVGREPRIIGVTHKDDTTLARFNRLGYSNTFRYQPDADLGLYDSCAGLESIQFVLDEPTASRLAGKHGQADVLLARHVLEHAQKPDAFLRALGILVKPGGHLVFEVPDCTKFIKACDYSFVWEEHIAYISAKTLVALIRRAGFSVHETILHPYPLEDSLIGVVKNEPDSLAWRPAKEALASLLDDGQNFARRHHLLRARMQALFRGWKKEGKRVAIFGAGHLAAKFANMYSLGDLIECVIDDNPHKQALLMPGSRMPIRGSAQLSSIDVCLLSLNPESEQKVMAKHQNFLKRGGQFLSIFALSSTSVYPAAVS